LLDNRNALGYISTLNKNKDLPEYLLKLMPDPVRTQPEILFFTRKLHSERTRANSPTLTVSNG